MNPIESRQTEILSREVNNPRTIDDATERRIIAAVLSRVSVAINAPHQAQCQQGQIAITVREGSSWWGGSDGLPIIIQRCVAGEPKQAPFVALSDWVDIP